MKHKFRFLLIAFLLLTVLSFNVKPAYANYDKVYLGGMTAGFSLNTKGATVVGLCDVITDEGIKSPAKDIELKIGDVILNIDKFEVNSAEDIEKALKNSLSKEISIKRNDKIITEIITPAKDLSGFYRLGIFVKDNVDGIGTITFIKGNRFASLGHPVADEYGEIINITGGDLYKCNITGCVKGERGKAGELRGVFISKNKIASIDKNNECGVYGTLENEFVKNYDLVEIEIGQAHMGDAEIYSTIFGDKPEKYNITIIKTDFNNKTKNFVIKINDEKLLEKTSGIVQGMSGSPIVQDGKLIGAVTHVFINDPTRGFGISIDNMINN